MYKQFYILMLLFSLSKLIENLEKKEKNQTSSE